MRPVGHAVAVLALLPEVAQGGVHLAAVVVEVELHVVTHRAGREEADHAVRADPLLLDHLVEHRLRVVVQLAGRRSGAGVVEDVGERALHLPRVEERLPVDVAPQGRQVLVAEHPHVLARPHAGERRDRVVLLEQHVGLGRVVVRPVDRGRVGAGLLQRHHRPVVLGRVARAQGVEVGLDVTHELLATGRAEQRRCGGHGPGRVLDPHHGAVVLLVDLDRGVGARGGGAADEERDLEAEALHLRGEVDHLVERRRDQARTGR